MRNITNAVDIYGENILKADDNKLLELYHNGYYKDVYKELLKRGMSADDIEYYDRQMDELESEYELFVERARCNGIYRYG